MTSYRFSNPIIGLTTKAKIFFKNGNVIKKKQFYKKSKVHPQIIVVEKKHWDCLGLITEMFGWSL